jgi:hypothetical protein
MKNKTLHFEKESGWEWLYLTDQSHLIAESGQTRYKGQRSHNFVIRKDSVDKLKIKNKELKEICQIMNEVGAIFKDVNPKRFKKMQISVPIEVMNPQDGLDQIRIIALIG